MSRQSRLAEQIRRELSNLVQLELRDPRMGMVTISAVDLSRDYSVAKVYFTVLEEDKVKPSKKALESAAGFLRKGLASKLSMRSLPRLTFFHDTSIERGRHLTSLIAEARAKDDLTSATSDNLLIDDENGEESLISADISQTKR